MKKSWERMKQQKTSLKKRHIWNSITATNTVLFKAKAVEREAERRIRQGIMNIKIINFRPIQSHNS